MRQAKIITTLYAEIRKSNGVRFIFICTPDKIPACVRVMSRWAMTADLPFGLRDARDVTEALCRQAMRKGAYG